MKTFKYSSVKKNGNFAAEVFSSSVLLSENKRFYENNWTKGVQTRMQVGSHWLLSFVSLFANV